MKPNFRGLCVVPCQLEPPRQGCYVCSGSELSVHLDTSSMTVKEFEEKVLRKKLNFAQPDVVVDGKGVILISSEEGETEVNNPKTLREMKVSQILFLSLKKSNSKNCFLRRSRTALFWPWRTSCRTLASRS